MKLKLFDRFQHYYLDKIWENVAAGKDVPAQLDRYLLTVEGSMAMEDFIRTLHGKLREMPAVDPDNGQWRTWGFVVPFHGQPDDMLSDDEYEPALAIEIHETGAVLICVEKREKVLPSSAINDALFDRGKAMAEREDRELNRKDWAVLKEEVTAQLLKTAPVRRSRIYVLFDQRDLIVFTSSQKAAEDTTAIIRKCFSSLPTVPAYTNEAKMQVFFEAVIKHSDDYKNFIPGTNVKLKSDEGEVVTVKDGEIDDERYTELLQRGFSITELEFAVTTNLPGMERIWAKMNHKADVKTFTTSSDSAEGEDFDVQYERGAAGFQSKMAELWMQVRAIREFNYAMAATGVMVDRKEINQYDDGDTLAAEKEAGVKAKGKLQTADAGEEEVDDEWEIPDEEEEDDGDI